MLASPARVACAYLPVCHISAYSPTTSPLPITCSWPHLMLIVGHPYLLPMMVARLSMCPAPMGASPGPFFPLATHHFLDPYFLPS